jgi:hypothetical protein
LHLGQLGQQGAGQSPLQLPGLGAASPLLLSGLPPLSTSVTSPRLQPGHSQPGLPPLSSSSPRVLGAARPLSPKAASTGINPQAGLLLQGAAGAGVSAGQQQQGPGLPLPAGMTSPSQTGLQLPLPGSSGTPTGSGIQLPADSLAALNQLVAGIDWSVLSGGSGGAPTPPSLNL